MSSLAPVGAPMSPAQQIKRYLQENAVLGETRRFRQLDRFESFYACHQYDHLQHDWWGMNADNLETVSPDIQVPLGFTQPALDLSVRMRRPTAPYNLSKAVVDRFTGLLFSEQRRPEIIVEGDRDTEDSLLAAMEQMRFWAKMREARTIGGSLGAVLGTVHLREGKFSIEVHNPKHVQVVWKDRRTFLPAAVLKCYKYPVEIDDVDPKTGALKGTKIVFYLYRRIITAEDDTVYVPVPLDDPTADLSWQEESTVRHDLGFFPGVWIQNRPVMDQEDGDPDCHGAWQGFDTYDRILAQMNKAVLLNLDPTLVLKVDPRVEAAQGGVRKGSDHAISVGAEGSAGYLEITGAGVEAGVKMLAQIKQNILDVVRCVMVDPQTLSGSAQSAKSIEYIYAPMLEAADDLRAQYGDLGVLPLLQIIEQIMRKFGDVGQLRLPLGPDGLPNRLGQGGYIRIKWGPYFSPTEMDKQLQIGNVVAAKAGGLIDLETAIKQVAPVFEIRNPADIMAKVRDEEQADLDKAMAQMGDGGVPFGAAESPTFEGAVPGTRGKEPQTMPAGQGGKP